MCFQRCIQRSHTETARWNRSSVLEESKIWTRMHVWISKHLTSRDRPFHEQCIVIQLVKNFNSLWNPKVHRPIRSVPLFFLILNSVQFVWSKLCIFELFYIVFISVQSYKLVSVTSKMLKLCQFLLFKVTSVLGFNIFFLQLYAPHSSLCLPSPAVLFLPFYNEILNCSSMSFSFLLFSFVPFFVMN